jgi:hypothetical protein
MNNITVMRKISKSKKLLRKYKEHNNYMTIKPNYESFGCEVVKDHFPTKIEKLRKKLGLGRVLVVKRRKNGMTSSGAQHMCHSNVSKLVKHYGGRQLLGYIVFEDGDGVYDFLYHSVWITPEGIAVDVTDYGVHLQDASNDLSQSIHFIPVCVSTPGVWIECESLRVRTDFASALLIYDPRLDEAEMSAVPLVVPALVKPIENANHLLAMGGFSKPSIRTGKFRNSDLQVAA